MDAVAQPNRSARDHYNADLDRLRCWVDRVIVVVFALQFVIGIALAIVLSPATYDGVRASLHPHVVLAVVGGLLISVPPMVLVCARPGWWLTRQSVAVAQMAWSALFIHLSGGRIETHFHVFASLAILAMYRDVWIFPTATAIVAIDHLLRGAVAPASVYGALNPEWWRFLEHAFWVACEDAALVCATFLSLRDMRLLAERAADAERAHTQVEALVTARTAELHAKEEQFRAIVETTNALPWELDIASACLSYVGPQSRQFLGIEATELVGKGLRFDLVHPEDRERVVCAYERAIRDFVSFEHELRVMRAPGRVMYVREVVSAVRDSAQRSVLRALTFDITERKRLEGELQHAQKLESVGRLAAGVAHEMNTPLQYAMDNVHFLDDSMKDVVTALREFRGTLEAVARGDVSPAQALADAQLHAERSDIDYLVKSMPEATASALEGLGRVASIVSAMKDFAHPGSNEKELVDLKRAIESTVAVARNEYKYVADLELDLALVPRVRCNLGSVNQAILNLVVNAAHAIAAVGDERGRIVVKSWQERDAAVISVSDTGTGITPEIRDRIFDPFFTTKVVGRGTGQGLAIARNVIVDQHGGSLTFDTELGRGTTFFVRLPLEAARVAA